MDSVSRLNYIYQAAHKVLQNGPKNKELVRFYIHELKKASYKLRFQLHPDIKRSLCKKCSSLLFPGVTSTVRCKGKKGNKHTVVTCNDCGVIKRFNTAKEYRCWVENPNAYIQKLNPTSKGENNKKQAKNEL